MIIHFYVYLFVTPYKREIPLMKIIFFFYIPISLSCFLLLSLYNFTTFFIFFLLFLVFWGGARWGGEWEDCGIKTF